MDSSTIDFFFSLLRSGLYGTPIPDAELPSTADWRSIMMIAKKQSVMALIIDAVTQLPERLQPSAKVKAKMFNTSFRVMKTHERLDNTLVRVVEFYRNHGIEGVLIKGQGIARCYREPRIRQCGDIDFYVGESNYVRGAELAREHFSQTSLKISRTALHYSFMVGEVDVELHRRAAIMYVPHLRRKFQRWLSGWLDNPSRWRSLDFNGTGVNIPSATFDAFYIFYHAWMHSLHGGVGLRQLCDWAMVLHRHGAEIDREELRRALSDFGLLKSWEVFGAIAVDYLGLPQEEMPFYVSLPKYRDAALDKVLDGGNFGFYAPGVTTSVHEMSLFSRKMWLLRRRWRSFTMFFTLMPLDALFFFIGDLSRAFANTLRQALRKP